MVQARDDQDPCPEALCRFVAAEWPGDLSAATHAWGQACKAWLEANPGRVLPHSADPVEVLQEVVRVRRELGQAGAWRGDPGEQDGSWHD